MKRLSPYLPILIAIALTFGTTYYFTRPARVVSQATAAATNADPSLLVTNAPAADTNALASAGTTNLTGTVPGALLPATPPTNPPPARLSLTPEELDALVRGAVQSALSNQPPIQVTVSNSPAPTVAASAPQTASVTNTPQGFSPERFIRRTETNRMILDAKWETPDGNGKYFVSQTFEAGTAGAQLAPPQELPSVAQLIATTKGVQVVQAPAPAAAPAKVAVSASLDTNQVAQGQTTQATAATATAASLPLKNPTVLKDGKLIELRGEWMTRTDGSSVFALAAEEPPQQVATAASQPQQAAAPGQVMVAGQPYHYEGNRLVLGPFPGMQSFARGVPSRTGGFTGSSYAGLETFTVNGRSFPRLTAVP